MMTKNHIAEVLFLPVHSEINNCCFPVKGIRDSFGAQAAEPGTAFGREPTAAFPSCSILMHQ